MNIELLEKTAQWLEAGAPERNFNMNKLLDFDTITPGSDNWCGTTCCIAGYVWQQVHPVTHWGTLIGGQWGTKIESQAAGALRISRTTADRLFYPSRTSDGERYDGVWDEITPAQAARAVRNVMERGEPYWEEILDFEAAPC
ncbi:MAG: hypothetical protein EBR82_56305 [Caulobacteraceae bacterium]|nr:hypothetical protein [Caulobacteraceae bacterium]